jgi:galactokinase
MIEKVTLKFRQIYNADPEIFRSPGRVNILGEHTDYNDGFVLPAAIDKAIYIAIGKREDELIHLYAQDFDQMHDSSLQDVQPTPKQWPNYILGVVDQLQKRGLKIGGFNLVIDGEVPLGAGLSSSAAVECATAFALNSMFNLGLDRMTMVKIAQKAEHTFAGVMCGIMDQFASMFGKKDHVVKLDCRSLEYEYVPLDLKGIKILLLNTNVKHNLASSEYNTRRLECEKGISIIRAHHPQVQSLRDVTIDMLNEFVKEQDPLIYRRCKYVVEENERLIGACEDLKRGDLVSLGKTMYATHKGLSEDYEVSCRESDFLVDYVKNNPAVLGARMMGGGFGGCTINLVHEDAIDQLIVDTGREYTKATGLTMTPYIAQVGNGSEKVSG